MKIPDLNDLIADLQTAKQIAIDDRNPNAIVTATMSQAKLLGMDNMRDVTPNNNIKSGLGHFYGNREPEPIADYSTLTDDELRQLQTITEKMQRGDNV
jgi:hypothetical protein|tara:strand:- start:213 stop:506 length:294 start_codon:yes stop_codon:yes gene_type:complete